jgi:hypothetical protein
MLGRELARPRRSWAYGDPALLRDHAEAAIMKFLAALDLGGYGGGYAATVKPSPGLREGFESEALERARAADARRVEHERLVSMTQEERRAYIEEQRTKLAEIKRLHEPTSRA